MVQVLVWSVFLEKRDKQNQSSTIPEAILTALPSLAVAVSVGVAVAEEKSSDCPLALSSKNMVFEY